MEKILNFGQFMMFVGAVLLVGSAVALLLPSVVWYLLGAKIVSNDVIFLTRAQIPWAVAMGILSLMLKDREVSDLDAREYLVALSIGCGLSFFLALYAAIAGILNGFGWFPVFLFLALTLLCVYFLRGE